jgi:hypothetical protein
MSSNQVPAKQAQVSSDVFGLLGAATDYAIDAAQRTVLFWDVMRQRGNQYRQHLAETVPNVLTYEAELIIDGRTRDAHQALGPHAALHAAPMESFATQVSGSSGSGEMENPSSLHMLSIAAFSLSTWPSMSLRPSARAYSMIICMSR